MPIQMERFIRGLLPFPYPDRPGNMVATDSWVDKGAPSRIISGASRRGTSALQ